MVGHIIRFNPAIQSLKQRLMNGDLGHIFQIFCRRIGPFPARIRDVGVVVDPDMVAWFDENVTPAGAHPGRWRRDFDDETCQRIDRHYAEACERLRAGGVDIPA